MRQERFPGFQECMDLMRKPDSQLQENGFRLLLPHAHEYTQQIMDEFAQDNDPDFRRWLLELLAEAREPKALPLLSEYLQSDDGNLRILAIRGLKQLNTKEARRALWEAKV